MSKRIVYFTKYARNGASSRLRSYQYIDLLHKEPNVKVTVQNLFSETYINKLYSNSSIKLEALKGYFFRLLFLFKIFKYDKVVIEKELFPYFPAFFERILSFFKIDYIVDYDDAIFHNYDQHPNKWIRFFLKNKIKTVMQLASCVTAGNKYLAAYAVNAGAKKVVEIPTVIDIDRYCPKQSYNLEDKLTIGWVGTPKTIQLFQKSLQHILFEYEHNFKIMTIGGKLNLSDVPYEFVVWTEKNEVENIKKIDVGIMPLLDSDFEKGKCGYKLIQYMACGIPVIASAVGVNNEIVAEGVNGFLVHSPNDWKNHINFFIKNPDLLQSMGKQARETVLTKYTLQIQYPIIKKLLDI